jgi:hypothetical protein
VQDGSGVVLPRLRLDLSAGLDDGVFAVISALKRIDGSYWRKNALDGALFA